MTTEERIKYLSYDSAFGILTRGALELTISEIGHGAIISIYALDLNHIHTLNRQIGYNGVNVKVRGCFKKIREKFPQLIIGRIFSGDEIAIIDFYGQGRVNLEQGIMAVFKKRGLSFKFNYTEVSSGKGLKEYSKILTQLSIKFNTDHFYRIM